MEFLRNTGSLSENRQHAQSRNRFEIRLCPKATSGSYTGGKRVCLCSLRLGFQLRRSYNQGLVAFKRASTKILRARQRFLCKFCLAELPIGQIQLIMYVAVMVRRSRPFEFRDGIGK